MSLKRCTKCGEEQPHSQFNKDKSKKDGLKSWCKKCCREKYKESVGRMLNYISLRGNKCDVCGGVFPIDLYSFHHVTPSDKDKKSITGSAAWTLIKGLPGGRTWCEADKCAMLCLNCHAIEHLALKEGHSTIPDGFTTPDGSTVVINHT